MILLHKGFWVGSNIGLHSWQGLIDFVPAIKTTLFQEIFLNIFGETTCHLNEFQWNFVCAADIAGVKSEALDLVESEGEESFG